MLSSITPAAVFCQLSSISLIGLVSVIVDAYFAKDERGFAKHEGFLPSPNDNVTEDHLGFSFSSLPFKLESSKMQQWKKLGKSDHLLETGPECDEYIQIFEYSNILITNVYSVIHSYQFST